MKYRIPVYVTVSGPAATEVAAWVKRQMASLDFGKVEVGSPAAVRMIGKPNVSPYMFHFLRDEVYNNPDDSDNTATDLDYVRDVLNRMTDHAIADDAGHDGDAADFAGPFRHEFKTLYDTYGGGTPVHALVSVGP